MRILFDATPLQTGHRLRGIGTYTRQLLAALLRIDRDNEYRLIAHHGDDDLGLGQPLPDNASVVSLPRPAMGRFSAFVSHQLFLPQLLATEKGDLFHSPGFVAAFSVPGVPWRRPQPLVLTLHDFSPLHMPELYSDKSVNRWWYQRQLALARHARELICVSEATRQDAVRFLQVSPARCTVIPEGVDRRTFHPRSPDTPATEPPFVLLVGGDFPNKNRATALAAFAQLCRNTSLPHQLLMVGRDASTDDQLAGRYPGIDTARVRRVLQVSQEELARLYRDADLLLLPSTYEGFGLPVLEAMASGTPVVASQASSLPEVAGGAAILVDPHDAAALAEAMILALSDRTLHRQLRALGLAQAAQFSWETTAQRTLEVYRRAASV